MKDAKPAFRYLRGYAFDPSLSLRTETALFNQILYKVDWEDLEETDEEEKKGLFDPKYKPQGPGPIGEYIEVLDYDPTVKKYFEPVDLNDKYVLAKQGLAPSESNPLFHQQMVYAVCMTTIKNFERALGRKILWSARRLPVEQGYSEYVQRLRIYPHALREANAYYSPQKKSLLFGYFSATPANEALQMPNSLVFTCLSHDIIAHETTHAILDGIHNYYSEATNPDVLSFHEAFADVVALFQHFTFPEVLKRQIAETRGDLQQQNLLGKLAQQMGSAIGRYGSLRDALGEIGKDNVWHPKIPDPSEYRTTTEAHDRGSILVAAVFEAFLNIYKNRVADLLRIATNGTGILPQGELHPDLVNRLASEASRSAQHVLNMCIRALDYCPPVDITFGDFLRAIITADLDLVSEDDQNYRLSFIDAFRRRGIYPQGIKTLSVESLRFEKNPTIGRFMQGLLKIIQDHLKKFREKILYVTDRKQIDTISKQFMGGGGGVMGLHARLTQKFSDNIAFEKLTGLVFSEGWRELGVKASRADNTKPSFQVQNLRVVSRVGPDGDQTNYIIFSLIQTSGAIMEKGEYKGEYQPKDDQPPPAGGFEVRGGCTLIFDLDHMELKYVICRPLLDQKKLSLPTPIYEIDKLRIENEYKFQLDRMIMGMDGFAGYFGGETQSEFNEPFAFLHQH